MRVVRAAEYSRPPDTLSPNFSGPAAVRFLEEWAVHDAEKMHAVVCAAGSRSRWHTHGAGQVLVVVSGTGLVAAYANDAVEVVEVSIGDLIVSDAGERHWHGAADEASCVYVSVSRGMTDWEQ